jgi:hypothetical protein
MRICVLWGQAWRCPCLLELHAPLPALRPRSHGIGDDVAKDVIAQLQYCAVVLTSSIVEGELGPDPLDRGRTHWSE